MITQRDPRSHRRLGLSRAQRRYGALLAQELPAGETYFDRHWLGSWIAVKFPGASLAVVAQELGTTRPTLQEYLSGAITPLLDNYLRMCCRAGVPVGTWLRHVSPEVLPCPPGTGSAG